jgi:hypothetical protein
LSSDKICFVAELREGGVMRESGERVRGGEREREERERRERERERE